MSRRKRSKGSGGGKGVSSNMYGLIGIVLGGVLMMVALINFGIGLAQLDTAYTAAATYTEQVGLTDIMGIFGLVTFLLFVGAGLGALTGGSVLQWFKVVRGGWTEALMGFVTGTVGLVIAFILNTLVQSQLHTVYTTAANVTETVNIAQFVGMLDIMTIFGMIIFISLYAAGASGIIAGAYGAFRQVKGGMGF